MKLQQKLLNVLKKYITLSLTKLKSLFITIHLRGAKRKGTKDSNSEEDNSSKRFVNLLIQLHEYRDNILKIRKNLIEGLTLHINPAINRLKSNIETYNPLTGND